ncbi:MAG: DeoR/GlpR family DNA-binding transcription regulator [Fusobacteriaceae bacterium]|jgi:DeoR family fructose operon transcriptional repressor|nr:DeoR/GlpR family DNA-binding transcription regulator [Fusobacteriaceae bacterium]
MLTEKRFLEVLNLVNSHGTIGVQDLAKLLNVSESTIRRDIVALHDMGKLRKIYGGATSLESITITKDDSVTDREIRNLDEKLHIAQAAASLILPDDFVYIDAGTTTAILTEQIVPSGAIFVTNAIPHAKTLAWKGCKVYLLGGRLKLITDAIIGGKAIEELLQYRFTKGFFGANGISIASGYSTPDIEEAAVKRRAFLQCQKAYVLADSSKFGVVSSISYASFHDANIITTSLCDATFRSMANIIEIK